MGLSTELRNGKWVFHCTLYGVCLEVQNQGVIFVHLVDGGVQSLSSMMLIANVCVVVSPEYVHFHGMLRGRGTIHY
jgi:hypothetical protein